jgi:hypothetical protein
MGSSTMNMAPLSKKAVLILEGEDGSVMAMTVYDPRTETHYESIHSARAESALYFTQGKVFSFTGDSTDHKAVGVYAEARQAALQERVADIAAMATTQDLAAVNNKSHEEALLAVYNAGLQAGMHHVEFGDAHFEQEAARRAASAAEKAIYDIKSEDFPKKTRKGILIALNALRAWKATL